MTTIELAAWQQVQRRREHADPGGNRGGMQIYTAHWQRSNSIPETNAAQASCTM